MLFNFILFALIFVSLGFMTYGIWEIGKDEEKTKYSALIILGTWGVILTILFLTLWTNFL